MFKVKGKNIFNKIRGNNISDKIKSKNISDKIIRAIMSIALLCSLLIGIAGIAGISAVNSLSRKIYFQNMAPLDNIYKVDQDFLKIDVNIRNMALERSNADTCIAQNKTYYNDMINQLNIYGNNITSSKDREGYNLIQSNLKKYKKLIDWIMDDINRSSNSNSNSNTDIGANISINGLSNENILATKLESEVTNEFLIKKTEAQQRNQTANILFYSLIGIIAIVVAAFIFIAIKVGKRIANNICDPINKVVAAAESVSKGNFNLELDIDTEDETKTLAEAFKSVISAFRKLETDTEMLISEASEGNLEARADTQNHEGEYRNIISGINKMLDTVKVPLDAASDYINRLADGEKLELIDNDYKGYYSVIIENINKVIRSVNILDEESYKLSCAGQNGDLDVRGDASRLKGVYSQIIDGVNQTFDSIKAPLDSAAGFISELADGTAEEPLENKYKGYYATLIDNLNGVLNVFLVMVKETKILNEAAQNGNLDVRGDLSEMRGNYASIISGFNDTLDAVVAPLNESSKVLSAIACNDFTSEMTGTYRGAYKKFADSINTVRTHLLSIQDALIKVKDGDLSQLEEFKKIGKRSENDEIMPSLTGAYQTIQSLIDETNRLAEAAYEGKLDERGDTEQFSGGYCKIIEGLNKTLEVVSEPLKESSEVLRKFALGDLTISMNGEYKGSYNLIKDGLNGAINSFNNLLTEIAKASEQVSVSSRQVSDGSQLLSRGATEQASSIEQLITSIAEISTQTKQNASDATKANTIASDAQGEAAEGTKKMSEMLVSMNDINEASSNISKVIKVIDDIAFQTNILALNAAVEAARAGQYGKGFAVVADEVRNLAAKSAQAANETTDLIENSMTKVESGTRIASETADTLSKISNSVQKVTALIGNIAAASTEQAAALNQINQGVGQVSTVVQTNSATAEESAASSEELSGQSETLSKMVAKFKLNDSISSPKEQDKSKPSGVDQID